MKNMFLVTLLFAVVMLVGNAFVIDTSVDGDPWDVPAKFQKMQNPVESDASSLKTGKALWVKHCKSCHGNEGLGDGPKAAQLDTNPGDFSTAAFHKQSDGAMFYKTKFGRDEMPNYEKKIPDDEDIWHLVNYMKTFK